MKKRVGRDGRRDEDRGREGNRSHLSDGQVGLSQLTFTPRPMFDSPLFLYQCF